MTSYGQYCGLAAALDRIGDRWTLLIVRELLVRPCRYTDIREALPGVATNLLAERLRRLESDGIVRRRELPAPATTAVYELTPLGRELEPAVLSLVRWGGTWMERRPRGSAFRAHWLGIALRALLHPPPELDVVVAILTGAERVVLHARAGAIDIASDEIAAAELEAAPEIVLGIAAGKVGLESAEREGTAIVRGDRRALRGVLQPALVAARG